MRNRRDVVRGQIDRWIPGNISIQIGTCISRILHAMEFSAFSVIRDPRLQVVVMPKGMIWAYFPFYKRRWIARQLPYSIEPRVKVLLVVGEESVRYQPKRRTMAELAHHSGHALCYLGDPGSIHGCPDADRAARRGGLSQFLRTPREIYGRRKRDFYCDLSRSTISRKLQRLEELNRA